MSLKLKSGAKFAKFRGSLKLQKRFLIKFKINIFADAKILRIRRQRFNQKVADFDFHQKLFAKVERNRVQNTAQAPIYRRFA